MTSFLLDVQPAPEDRVERAIWLQARADKAAAVTRAALRRIVGEAYQAWTATLPEATALTASGDLQVLNSIPQAWMTFVEDELVGLIAETQYAGVMTAWVSMAGTMTPQALDGWAAVVNEMAVSYMTDATNRLSAVGDTTWRQVRSQTVTAIEKGLTNEELKGRLETVTRWSEYRADTVARTETNAAYVQGELAGQRALGSDGPVEKVWVAALDDRTRDTHADAHDQCVPITEPFNVGGVMMDAPFDTAAPPEEVVNCRCVVEYLYPGDTRPDGTTVDDPAGAPDASTDEG